MKPHNHHLIVQGDVKLIEAMAVRFVADRESVLKEAWDVPEDEPMDEAEQAVLKACEDELWAKGGLLRLFQRNVMELMDAYRMPYLYDDLVTDLMANNEDGDLTDVIAVVKEFEDANPAYLVINLVPIDFKGSVGYVVTNKDA